jgi:hypothetical protein
MVEHATLFHSTTTKFSTLSYPELRLAITEDSCQISKKHIALMMGVLWSIQLNLLRFAGVSSVREGIMKMSANLEGLLGLMNPSSPSSKVFV